MPINYSAHAAATRLATAEADMSKIITRLRVARGDASVYQNADLTSVGLQARREEMDMAARRAAAAPLERLRAQVAPTPRCSRLRRPTHCRSMAVTRPRPR